MDEDSDMAAAKKRLLISNPMRCTFGYRKANNATAPASDHSLAGAVLYSVTVMYVLEDPWGGKINLHDDEQNK